MAAFLAIFEASVEHKFRKYQTARSADTRDIGRAEDTSLNMIERIRLAKFRSHSNTLSYDKVKTVFWISSIAVVGELFHGFGDLLYESCENLFRLLLE
jgi:hypothetical protein